ncbi:MAG: hypothetical protein R3E62_09910 [Pseudomonadales bacterium]
MTSEYEKGVVELSIFRQFAKKAGLKIIDGSPRKSDPNEGKPDIFCLLEEGPTYFELTEACAPEFVAAVSNGVNRHDTPSAWHTDVSEETVQKKLEKNYQVSEPVELLIYTAGRTALPDREIINKVREVLSDGPGPFSRIWLFGEDITQLFPLEQGLPE